jgi:hypothetical protein
MSKSLVTRTDPLHAMAAASQTHLMETVTRFGGYADRTGAMATSMKGLVISINRDIKRAYGMARDDMPRDMLLHVSSALVRVVEIIECGMRDGETRADIKRAVHAAIQASGASYAGLMGSAHVQH